MKTDYLPEETFKDILKCLMPANALVCLLMIETGMRISDALAVQRVPESAEHLAKLNGMKLCYQEKKTGKDRCVMISPELMRRLIRFSKEGPESPYIFPGRLNGQRPRTRQAVWKDLNRCASLWRINGKKLRRVVGTHTARKLYAVKQLQRYENEGIVNPMERVRQDMNHADLAVTFIYAMSDIISERRKRLTV